MESYNRWSFTTSIMFSGFIHVVVYISTSFFLLANHIPEYEYTTVCLFIYPLMDIWCISTFWLLWKTLLGAFKYKFLYKHMFSFLLDIYVGVELLGHMVAICLVFWGTAKHCSKITAPFYNLTSNAWEFQIFHIFAHTCYDLSWF